MTAENGRPARDEPVVAAVFARVYGTAVGGAIVLLVAAAVWLGLAGAAADARLAIAACAWAVAVAAAAVLFTRRRDPLSSVSIVAQVVALLGTATTFGFAGRATAGVLVSIPMIAFLLLAVIATVLRAGREQQRRAA